MHRPSVASRVILAFLTAAVFALTGCGGAETETGHTIKFTAAWDPEKTKATVTYNIKGQDNVTEFPGKSPWSSDVLQYDGKSVAHMWVDVPAGKEIRMDIHVNGRIVQPCTVHGSHAECVYWPPPVVKNGALPSTDPRGRGFASCPGVTPAPLPHEPCKGIHRVAPNLRRW